jgi:integrase
VSPALLRSTAPSGTVETAQSHRAKEGEITLARRRWQNGCVYLRKSTRLPDAWWGRYVETVETENGPERVHRNIRLGEAGSGEGQLTKRLAQRELRLHVDTANNYQPQAVKEITMGKAATPFSVFAERWQQESLVHKKASTQSAMKSHINTLLIPEFGKLAIGDVDSERVQSFLNRQAGKMAAKSVKNVWTTLKLMWKSAVAWKYVSGELQVELPKARKLRMRCYTTEEVKRILANSEKAAQIFFWLAAETGARVGELLALRTSDVDLKNMRLEISKALWNGEEDAPKTEAGNRSICISTPLSAALMEFLAGRPDGYLFQTSEGSPWDASNVLARKVNKVLERLEIPKIDLTLLAKIIGKGKTIDAATRREKRACSAGMHTFRHTNATAMDSLGIPHQIRKQRLGHSGSNVTESYTHTFTQDERVVAEKLGEFFGTGWPEKEPEKPRRKRSRKGESFPNLSQTQQWPAGADQQAIAIQ